MRGFSRDKHSHNLISKSLTHKPVPYRSVLCFHFDSSTSSSFMTPRERLFDSQKPDLQYLWQDSINRL